MVRYMNNMPIFRRLFIAFTLTTFILGTTIILLGVFYLNTLNGLSQSVKISFDAQNTASQEQTNLQRMNAQLETRFAQIYASKGNAVNSPSLKASGALIENDIKARELEFDQALQAYSLNFAVATSDNMKNIRTILLNDDAQNTRIINQQQTALDHVIQQKQWVNYQQAQDKVLTLLGENTSYADAYTALFQARQDFIPLSVNWKSVANSAVTIGTTVTNVGPTQIRPILAYTIGTLLFAIIIIIAAGYIINLTITQPLRNLASLTMRIARGDTSARAPTDGQDEIHTVAVSMNRMLDNIVQLMQEARYRHMELQSQIEKLVHEVSGMGEGDLRIQAEVLPNELGVLASSFNMMAGQLNNLVVNVKMMARGVQNAALQTFGHIEHLADDATVQLQQIKGANIEINNMTASSIRVAEHMRSLYTVANDGRQITQKGRDAVQRTVDSTLYINEQVHLATEKVFMLGERSREIHNVVEVISSVAQQTNRLALDAAIQAAMAGDQGTGFGAVAIDIRRLAERAKEQAVRIESIVKSVLEDISTATSSMQATEREVASGTTITKEVSNALESIFTLIDRQASEIDVTNQTAIQQLQSSRAVAQIIKQISQMILQSSTTTREANQHMKNLAQLAGQLLASVDVFKLQETHTPYIQEASPAERRRQRIMGSSRLTSISRPLSPISGELFDYSSTNSGELFDHSSTNSGAL